MSTLCSVGTLNATADEFPRADGWTPSLSMNFAFSFQDVRGSISSSQLTPAIGALRPFTDSQKFMTSPHVGGALEIMSPTLPIPLSPRLFFDGEVLHIANQRRRIAREGDPSGIRAPDRPLFDQAALLGRGSTTLVDLENVSYGAGIGIAFPLAIGDFSIMIKPSARYLRRTYKFSSILTEGFRTNGNEPPTRIVELRGSDDLDVDAIGPGLEFDVEAIETDRLGLSIFFNAAAFRIMGDREITFSATGTDSIGQDTFRSDATGILDQWLFRAGVGMRVKWHGIPGGWLATGVGN